MVSSTDESHSLVPQAQDIQNSFLIYFYLFLCGSVFTTCKETTHLLFHFWKQMFSAKRESATRQNRKGYNLYSKPLSILQLQYTFFSMKMSLYSFTFHLTQLNLSLYSLLFLTFIHHNANAAKFILIKFQLVQSQIRKLCSCTFSYSVQMIQVHNH